jgi:SAM-dependent methyltransferase
VSGRKIRIFPAVLAIVVVFCIFLAVRVPVNKPPEVNSKPELTKDKVKPSVILISEPPAVTPLAPELYVREYSRPDIQLLRKKIETSISLLSKEKGNIIVVYPGDGSKRVFNWISKVNKDIAPGYLGKDYYKERYNNLAKKNSEYALPDSKIYEDYSLKKWLPKNTDSIADIGAGPGFLTITYANSARELWLVDTDPDSIKHLAGVISIFNTRYPKRHYADRIVLVRSKSRDVCLPEENFNLIFVVNVHVWSSVNPAKDGNIDEFLKGKKEFFDSIIYSLKPGGRIILTDGHTKFNNFHFNMTEVKQHMEKLYVNTGKLKFIGMDKKWRSQKGYLLCYEKNK